MAPNPEFDNFAAAQRQMGGKIRTYARNALPHLPGYDLDDIIAELLVILWKCTLQYDPNKGAGFNTYAQTSFQRAILSMKRKVCASTRVPASMCVSLDAPLHDSFDGDGDDRALANVIATECSAEDLVVMGESISEHFAALSPRRQQRIRRDLTQSA